MTRVALLIPFAALSFACSGTPTEPAARSTSAASEPAATGTTTTTTTSAPLVEAEPQPAPEPTPEPAPTPSVEPPPLPPEPSNASTKFHLVALREGPLDMRLWQGRPYLLAGGMPIAIDAEGRPQPNPQLIEGIEPRPTMYVPMFETMAFGGSLEGEAWVTTRQPQNRAASEYDVYARSKGRWKRQKIEKGPIVEFHAAYVEREGALLGLRAYASNPLEDTFGFDEETPEATRFHRDFAAAMARAPQGFVHLSGPAPAALPELPRKLELSEAVQTRDGSLYALAKPPQPVRNAASEEGDEGDEDEAPPPEFVLLVWPPGQRVATELALRGVTYGQLFASGDVALVSDSEVLYVVAGTTLEAIPLDGVADEEPITSVASSPAGDLWLVAGEHPYARISDEGADTLWFRAHPSPDNPTPKWTKLSLPVPSGPIAAARERWVWDPDNDLGWEKLERGQITARPAAESVFYAQGAAWVVADIADVWGTERFNNNPRLVGVFSNVPTTHEPVELEPFDLMRVRQYAALGKRHVPGTAQCMYAFLRAGKPEDAAAIAAKLEALDLEGIYPGQLFVGELDGKRELVLVLGTGTPEAFASGLPLLREQLGVPEAEVDCRPRMLVEVIGAQ